MVGYLFETILGLLLTLALIIELFANRDSAKLLRKKLIVQMTDSFFNCAIFFAASIQIASIIVLVRRDFSISANGLGGYTTQITWCIALLSLLPLIGTMAALDIENTNKSSYRLFLFLVCWMLFFYSFVSQMIGYYSPNQIGEGRGEGGTTIISTENWDRLEDLCLVNVNRLTTSEQNIISRFGATGSIIVTVYGLIRLLWYITSGLFPELTARPYARKTKRWFESRKAILVWCAVFILIAVPQFWAVFRLRGIQRALARNTNNTYTDNEWTFGQVVAVMLFAPVFTDVGFLWLRKGEVDYKREEKVEKAAHSNNI